NTVSVALPEMEPILAWMVVIPPTIPTASPVLETLATEVLLEVQFAEPETSSLLPSVKVPVATNCWLALRLIDELEGVTVNDCKTAEVTVREVDALSEPREALIVVGPAVTPCAIPELVIVAVPGLEELQLAELVRFWVLPSVKV